MPFLIGRFMRKRNLLLFIILMLFPVLVFAKNDIYLKNADIYINKDGSANVTETWDVKGQDGTEWYIPLTNLGQSEILNYTVSMDGKDLKFKSWNIDESISQKAGYYGINYVNNGMELCFGKTDYKRHTFVIKYTITNFVFTTSDADVISWRIFEYQNSSTNWENFTVNIKSFYSFPDTLDVWGYGYKGYAYVKDGMIQMSNEGDMGTNYVVLQAKFPKGTFENLVTYSQFETFDDVKNMNDEGKFDYDYDLDNEYSNLSTLGKIWYIIKNIISTVFPFALFVWIAVMCTKPEFGYKDNKKIDKNNTPMFRDIPCNKDIYYANTLIYLNKFGYKEGNIIGAIILKWIKEDKVRYIKRNDGTRKEESVLDLTSKPEFTEKVEQELFDIMYKASEDGYLESKELEKYCRNHYSKFFSIFTRQVNEKINSLEAEGKIYKKINKKDTKAKKIMDESIYEDSQRLFGLKLFFNEFAKMDTKETLEVKIWDEYLMFAYLFGMADKVSKQLKNLYPEYIEQELERNNLDLNTLVLINSMTTRSVNAASAARSAAQSYSSGGGGFSSGGGGGGSFGGGGSSGGGGSR